MNSSKNNLKSRFCCECSSKIYIYAFGSCFHPICFRCSTALRVLKNDKKCPVCDMLLSRVMFTTIFAPEEEQNTPVFIKDQKYGIWAESSQIRNQYRALLLYKCPEKGCYKSCDSIVELQQHLNQQHKKSFCPICLDNEKVFVEDRPVYSIKQVDGSVHELWKHCIKHHHTCDYPSCRGKAVFYTDHELKKHTNTIHQHVNGVATSQFSKSLQNHSSGDCESSPLEQKVPKHVENSNQKVIKGSGKVMVVYTPFGFIERDDKMGIFEENIYFGQQACGYPDNQALSSVFEVGDKVYYHAVPHEHSRAKWKATYVKLLPDESADKITINAGIKPSNMEGKAKPDTSIVQRKDNEDNMDRQGIGKIFYKLGPKFGFIIPMSNIGINYKASDNVYFNVEAYRLGMNKKVVDLTKELEISEVVCYELDKPNAYTKRSTEKKYRAVKVWKYRPSPSARSSPPKEQVSLTKNEGKNREVKISDSNSISALDEKCQDLEVSKHGLSASLQKSNPTVPTSSGSTKPSNSKFLSELQDFQQNFQLFPNFTHQTPKTKPHFTQEKPSCSKTADSSDFLMEFQKSFNLQMPQMESPVSDSNSFNGLDTLDDFSFQPHDSIEFTGVNEIDVFRNVLKELMHGIMEESLFDLDLELASNRTSLSQVSCIRFSRERSPIIYPIWNPRHSPQLHFNLHGISGFDQLALKRMANAAMTVQIDDELVYVEHSNLYLILLKDGRGEVEEISLHTSFKAF